MSGDNTRARKIADKGGGLGLGLLCWKGYESFAAALETYQQAGLFEFFDETFVWFQEIDAPARALADRFGLSYAGTRENLGILGGFKALAGAMQSSTLLLLENDLPLIEPPEEVARQLKLAYRAVSCGQVQVFRLRHTRFVGQKFNTIEKYLRYHGPGPQPQRRRILRPGKAQRLAGTAVYVEEAPEQKFPQLIQKDPEGWYRVSSSCLPWTNQSVMVARDFFLDTIIAHAEANPSRRRVNGFPDIEKEWNTRKWRRSGWTIGTDLGLFTHERKE